MTSPIRTIGAIVKPNITNAWPTVQEMLRWAAVKGITVVVEKTERQHLHGEVTFLEREELAQLADLVVVLGGDGTMLASARLLRNRSVPVIGVNFGLLGYLTEFSVEDLFPTLERALTNDLQLDRRLRLDTSVFRNGKCIDTVSVLNDVVVNKSALARIIALECWIEGQMINCFRADGLIISTPTGSTAYSLSAGGPIVHPCMGAMLITPICPHTLTNRPLVVPDETTIDLVLQSPKEEVTLTLDGQIGIALQQGDRIRVRKSENYFQLVRSYRKNYFEILHDKLNWGR
jgi:NAD+ kinase